MQCGCPTEPSLGGSESPPSATGTGHWHSGCGRFLNPGPSGPPTGAKPGRAQTTFETSLERLCTGLTCRTCRGTVLTPTLRGSLRRSHTCTRCSQQPATLVPGSPGYAERLHRQAICQSKPGTSSSSSLAMPHCKKYRAC
eukprot:3885992-Rhodomonas_salina.3